MSLPEKQARVSPARESSAEEKNEQFQRAVLNMMQLHMMQLDPKTNVLAERVFERMPLEGFMDLPENGLGYDGLLSSGNCQVILDKFEKKEPLLRPLREEYECLNETDPRLSGVCKIVSRLWNVKYNEKMKSKNQVKIDIDDLFLKVGARFDFSTDFLVSTMRLYDDSFVDENGEEAKSFNGIKLTPLNVHMWPEHHPFVDSCSLYLFVYHLDRDDPKIVRPKLVRTIELADMEYHQFVSFHHKAITHFRVCGNILAVAKLAFHVENAKLSYGFEFYDMEKSRKDELDLIYTIDNSSGLGCDLIVRAGIDYGFADPDLDPSTFFDYKNGRRNCFFSENFFVCSRHNDDGNLSVEVHKIKSEQCSLVKNIELQAIYDPGRVYLGMFVESHGDFFISYLPLSLRAQSIPVICYEKKKNELTATIEKYGESERAAERAERVLKKLKSERNVFGHVRLGQEYDPGTGWTAYFKFYV